MSRVHRIFLVELRTAHEEADEALPDERELRGWLEKLYEPTHVEVVDVVHDETFSAEDFYGPDPDESMDGDHETALESVYGPEDYHGEYDDDSESF